MQNKYIFQEYETICIKQQYRNTLTYLYQVFISTVLALRLNISQFCWEKVQVLLGVWRYWEISGFCAGKQPAIISNKNIKNKNWEIPSKKQTYQTWVDTSNIILFQRNRHISGFKCRACVPNIKLVLFISSTMISMM
ncbi:Hypothetical_protein [Hexamita inflata]|uniref:Hypothetical_protein n=1 Tax=Hexamita inflata TaxID=28002 RepID=A0AA86VR75_9EUKA|nr:Hypothetical protein HINF_LOCUS61893 [Hexamita inflata]